jgi:APA family basic amino acid/polyamine antiporter
MDMIDKKKISPVLATAVGLGAIIGAGIFVLSGTAIALAGADSLLAFIIVGIVAIIMAFEFGELGSIFPRLKGASYSYVYKAFGSELGFLTGIIKYFSYATSMSVISIGFGSYLASLLGMSVNIYAIPFAILLMVVLSVITLLGMKKAASVDFGMVIIKILVLLIFVGFAFFLAFSKGLFRLSNLSVSATQGTPGALFAATIVIFFAYSGFQTITTLTPRIRGGGRAAAKATIASVLISMAIYVAVVFSLMAMLPASSYSINGDPLSLALQQTHAPTWLLIVTDIGAMIATASATLAMLISGSMMLFQISDDHLLPKLFRSYDKKSDVARSGVVSSAIIGIIMLFAGNIYVITSISNFGMLFAYLMTSFAVIHFRRRGVLGTFKTPLYPYVSVFAIVAILLFMFGMPKEALVIGVILVISLIIVYYALREFEDKRVIRIKLFK